MPIGAVTAIATALDATLDITLRWRGEGMDRLLDAVHAAIQNEVAGLLKSLGWLVQVEVSFNHYGDRGRVDVLAFHAGLGLLLVVEVKSAFGDLQGTLGRLDVKTRVGPLLARQAGWAPARAVIPAVVVLESRTARRVVAGHPALFAKFTCRGRAARLWIRNPSTPAPTGLMWVAHRPNAHDMRVRSTPRVRKGQNGG